MKACSCLDSFFLRYNKSAMIVSRIFPITNIRPSTSRGIREGQMEAGRLWTTICNVHRQARKAEVKWPHRRDLRDITKGGAFALNAQTVQAIVECFVVAIDNTTGSASPSEDGFCATAGSCRCWRGKHEQPSARIGCES